MAMFTSLCAQVIVMSSAYEAICIWGVGGEGMSCMYRLKSVGDNTDPWGTPLVKFLVLDV